MWDKPAGGRTGHNRALEAQGARAPKEEVMLTATDKEAAEFLADTAARADARRTNQQRYVFRGRYLGGAANDEAHRRWLSDHIALLHIEEKRYSGWAVFAAEEANRAGWLAAAAEARAHIEAHKEGLDGCPVKRFEKYVPMTYSDPGYRLGKGVEPLNRRIPEAALSIVEIIKRDVPRPVDLPVLVMYSSQVSRYSYRDTWHLAFVPADGDIGCARDILGLHPLSAHKTPTRSTQFAGGELGNNDGADRAVREFGYWWSALRASQASAAMDEIYAREGS